MKLKILITSFFLFCITINNVISENAFGISLYDELPPIVTGESETSANISDNVIFLLYTQNNTNKPFKIKYGDKKLLAKSPYNVSLPTKMVTHGWLSNGTKDSCSLIRDGLLKRGNFNVIVVDWSAYADNLNYITAAIRVKTTGRYVGKMINFLLRRGSNPENMTLIGHSLGAHVMGIAGIKAKKKLAHAVGLDPAGPGFTLKGSQGRITRHSARFVDIIHTNAGILGLPFPLGDSDFYPNGGSFQPGCSDPTCPHSRSYQYYAESLQNPSKWLAISCGSYNDFLNDMCKEKDIVPFPRWMPFPKPKAVYALRTNSNMPFGLGKDGVTTKGVAKNLRSSLQPPMLVPIY